MTQAKHFKPEAVVTFYTEKGELTARSKPKREGDAIDSEVLSILTQNDLGTDAGVFTLTLSAKNRWDLMIAPNDLVIIAMRNDPKQSLQKATVFFGLCDMPTFDSSLEGNNVQQQVTITGRTFAKAIINFEIGVVGDAGEIGLGIGWLTLKGVNFSTMSSAQIIQQLFDHFINKYTNYTFNNGKTLIDLLKLKLSSRNGESMPNSETTFNNYQGSMYSFFKELIDEPFDQMFFEVYDGKPTFTVRETPFNENLWKALPLHEVSEDLVVKETLSRNDLETYTLFSVGVSNHLGTLAGINMGTVGMRPLVYEPYLKKYGIRRLHRYSNYIGVSNPFDSSDMVRKYAIDLFNWNVMNPSFWSGQLTVKGDNHYKIGDRLLYTTSYYTVENNKTVKKKRELEFFIEGVSHEFINFTKWTTRLSLTRGLPHKGADRFKAPWGAYKEYQGGGVGDLTSAEVDAELKKQEQGLKQQAYVTSGSNVYSSGGTQSVAQYYLNSPFVALHNFGENRGTHIHQGEDLSAPSGTPIYALFDGRVVQNSYQAGGAGNYVVLQHPNGYMTKYFHMRDRSPLSQGTTVQAGALLGYVGSTGHSTGNHLHLEIWINGVVKSPLPILQQLSNGSSSSVSAPSANNWWGATKGGTL